MSSLPVGIITFLFTDIEGSTRLLQELGARYGDVLNDHHRLMRNVLQAHKGEEVSTEGDAFFVAFANPSDAVRAAADAQRALVAYAREKDLPVRVRMGLHTGEGRLFGDNYGGIDVHRAARIASAANGGQVLLSDSTRVLADAAVDSRIRFKDLGEHRLKDLERPEHLYQLCIDGLPSDFPPPRTLNSRPNNIPVTLTTFVSRERELNEICSLLKGNRLVTLTGPGGTGKTRLALQAASESLLSFPDGAFVALLAPVGDPALIPATIAESLGLRERGLTPIADLLKENLAGKSMLLVLDNFEQLLPGAPFVAELLAAAPEVKVLVTSRAPLRISGEQEYPVPPMSLPDPAHRPAPDELTAYESIALFEQRARGVRPDFAITERNAAAITEICRRLDGLPLAIELAAARLKVLSPQRMLEKLQGGLDFLSGGARDLPERQRALRAAIRWSYDLLDEPLRILFYRLAAFVGSWTVEAAEAVCNLNSELGIETFEGLDALAESSLVRAFETDDGSTRFRMLQTIREYGLELLHESSDAEMVRERHAKYFCDLMAEMEPKFTAEPTASRMVELEHDNIRSVLKRALDLSDAGLGLRLGGAAWRFWMLEWHLAEGRKWLEDFLSLPEAALFPADQAKATTALGSITYWQNDFEATARRYGEALDRYRELGDDAGTIEALYNSGFVALINYDAAGARKHYEESRALAQELDDKRGLANSAWGLAMTALQERNWDEARRLGAEAQDRYEALNDWFGVSVSRFVFMQVARFTGNLEETYRLVGLWLDAMVDSQSKFSVIELLSWLESTQGRHESAVRLTGAAQALRAEFGGGSPPPLIEVGDPLPPAREVIEASAVESLLAEGRAMTIDEAVTYVRKIVENEVA